MRREEMTYVPGWSAIECFGNVMDALPMAAEIEYFVLASMACVTIQARQVMLESLPLRQFTIRIIFGVVWIGSMDQAEVGFGLFPVNRLILTEVQSLGVIHS